MSAENPTFEEIIQGVSLPANAGLFPILVIQNNQIALIETQQTLPLGEKLTILATNSNKRELSIAGGCFTMGFNTANNLANIQFNALNNRIASLTPKTDDSGSTK